MRPVQVVDKQNDKLHQTLLVKLTEEQQSMLNEDKRAVGKISNDIVEVFVQ